MVVSLLSKSILRAWIFNSSDTIILLLIFIIQLHLTTIHSPISHFCCRWIVFKVLSKSIWWSQKAWDQNDSIDCNLGVHTLRPRKKDRHFSNDIFKCIFLNENIWIFTDISLKLISKGQINNKASLVQIMVWCLFGAKPLSEPMIS